MATDTIPTYFPSLSEDGWVTNALQKADYLFSQMMIADYSQSVLYSGKITSLPYIIQQGSGDPILTANLLETALENYFSNYFSNVTCSVTYPDGQADSAVYLNIALAFEDAKGKTYSLSKVFDLTNSKTASIQNLNDYGT